MRALVVLAFPGLWLRSELRRLIVSELTETFLSGRPLRKVLAKGWGPKP